MDIAGSSPVGNTFLGVLMPFNPNGRGACLRNKLVSVRIRQGLLFDIAGWNVPRQASVICNHTEEGSIPLQST